MGFEIVKGTQPQYYLVEVNSVDTIAPMFVEGYPKEKLSAPGIILVKADEAGKAYFSMGTKDIVPVLDKSKNLSVAMDAYEEIEVNINQWLEHGDYAYVWLEDAVGNTSEPKKVKITITPPIDPIPEHIIARIASEISNIHDHIAPEDKAAIRSAKNNVLNIVDSAWETILADVLTDNVISKFEDREDAKSKLRKAIEELAEIQYSVDSSDLESRLMAFAESNLSTFRAIFGYEESNEMLFGFIRDIYLNVPNAITPTQGNELIGATDQEMISLIEEIIKGTVDYTLDKYPSLRGKLAELNLSVNTLVGIRGKLAAEIDTDNAAQLSLIMAYTRSQSIVTGPFEVRVGETVRYTLNVLGKDVSTAAYWSSSATNVATIVDDSRVELTGVAEGETTITVYIGDDTSKWIYKFIVTVIAADELEESELEVEVEVVTVEEIESEMVENTEVIESKE